MNHKPTRDILGEPVYYSQRDLIADAVVNILLLLALVAVAIVYAALYAE